MIRQLVLTIVASDRPGIVQAVADVVAHHGGNWMDSSMVRLGGEFAGIVRVSVAQENADALEASLVALKDQGLAITVQAASAGPTMAGTSAHLMVSGADHPGIVRDISMSLAECGVSIEELHTEQFPASMTGQSMFQASALVLIPSGQGLDGLRERLERLAQDIMVEIDIQSED
jgi:glycine cleavage system regulatory protein